jgi:hypothetical protein
VARIGNLLVDGPFSIRAPREVDDYGWLECDLRLTHKHGGVTESVAVYVDDSVNREAHFLEPVIRYVRWERVMDIRRALAGEITWPTATVILSYFPNARTEVDRLMRDVQTRLTRVPFAVTGLVTDRSVPDATPDDRGEVEVFARNGVQRIEVSTWAADDGGLHAAVINGIGALRPLLRPLALDGWSESYAHDLLSTELGGLRRWDYRRPTDGAPAA